MLNRKELIKELRDLGCGRKVPEGLDCEYGICRIVRNQVGAFLDEEFRAAMRSWPEHSGSLAYPVPYRAAHGGVAMKDDISLPRAAGAFYHRGVDNWSGPYGCARRRLCLWAADRLDEGEGIDEDG